MVVPLADRWVAAAVGAALVLTAWASIVGTLIVPRPVSSWLTRWVDRSVNWVFRLVTGAITDHLTPWKGCYRTTELLSGPSTFVLSNAGHIASLVNPPGNPKATYYIDGEPGAEPDVWLKSATKRTGSWWQVWAEWSRERSGDPVPAPERLGSDVHPPLHPAPGLYVRDRTP